MRRIIHPLVDDADLLGKLRKSRSKSAKKIFTHLEAIAARYELYLNHGGNPWDVLPSAEFGALEESLHNLYDVPPVALSFIKSLRDSVQGSCPVCGRSSLGTLDHYLPKSNFQEFSFFSRNLVPACDRCNNRKGNLVRGDNPGERPVHPYFDEFASRRIMTIKVEPDWRAPRLSPVPFDIEGDDRKIVQWHIENIIRPAGIDDHLTHLWGCLIAEPITFCGQQKSREPVRASLMVLSDVAAAVGKSKNAWDACFYYGIATNNDALDYLVTLL